MEDKKIYRCAIYTRKSHEDGLEQEYNSLDAQREAGENYIASQKIKGWEVLPEKYDDGGFSGGTMERPALRRLLADVEAGLIDIIVVYKIDRLSRSLLDFMKLAEMLEERNVSFVSVTQDINTSTSAGRMMLNVLMTFAQYEREVIAERIRDKVAGAKRRGKYCGGYPVLGYNADPDIKKLIVNEKEAKLVRLAFNLYCQLASAKKVAHALNKKGFQTKRWKTRKGPVHESREFTSDTIYRLLNNTIYIGKVSHKGNLYEGEHEAIVDLKLWGRAKKVTEATRNAIGFNKCKTEYPFKGLLKCGYCGGGLGVTYSEKNGRRYIYYFCVKDDKKAVSECPIVRVPAGEVDRVILQQLSAVFRAPTLLAQIYLDSGEVDSEKKEALLQRKTELEGQGGTLREKMFKLLEENSESGKVECLKEELKENGEELFRVESGLMDLDKSKITHEDMSAAFSSIDVLWGELFPGERYRLMHLLIEKITVYNDNIKIVLKTHGMASLAGEVFDIVGNKKKRKSKKSEEDFHSNVIKPAIQADGNIALNVPIRIKRKKGRKIIIAPNSIDGEVPDAESPVRAQLVKSIARGNAWLEIIEEGEVPSISHLADKLNLNRSYISRFLRMANLAPDIQEAIINGDESESLSLEMLKCAIPADWNEQRKMFSFKLT